MRQIMPFCAPPADCTEGVGYSTVRRDSARLLDVFASLAARHSQVRPWRMAPPGRMFMQHRTQGGCPLMPRSDMGARLSGRGSGAGWFLGQDAELVAFGIGERDPTAAIGPPVVG